MTPTNTQINQPTADDELEGAPKSRASVSNRWAMLRRADRMAFLFQYDQLKLRYEYAIRREYRPNPSWWKKKKIKKDIELLFDDVNEEIYFQEQLSKDVKSTISRRTKRLARIQSERESTEEVLAGYDKFTVEEEKKITDMTKSAIEKMVTTEKQTGII